MDTVPFATVKAALNQLAQVEVTSCTDLSHVLLGLNLIHPLWYVAMLLDDMRRLGHFKIRVDKWLIQSQPSLVRDGSVRSFDMHLSLCISPREDSRDAHVGNADKELGKTPSKY